MDPMFYVNCVLMLLRRKGEILRKKYRIHVPQVLYLLSRNVAIPIVLSFTLCIPVLRKYCNCMHCMCKYMYSM